MNIGMAPARNSTTPMPMAKYQNHWRWRRELHAHVDHSEADPVKCVQDHGAEQRDFAEFEQRRAEGLEGGVELLRVLQVADRVHVDNQVADECDARKALDPEGEVADVSPGVLAPVESKLVEDTRLRIIARNR